MFLNLVFFNQWTNSDPEIISFVFVSHMSSYDLQSLKSSSLFRSFMSYGLIFQNGRGTHIHTSS